MADFKVLIVGGGISGSIAAYWLGKAGAHVTVIEKMPELQTVGQGLDMHGGAREIIKRMGVFDTICAKATKETGAAYVNAHNEVVAAFDAGVDEHGANQSSPTADIEIMRKDLVEILCQAASSMPSVTFKYNTEFLSMSEETAKDGNDGVRVEFTDGSTELYDLVVGADGLGSRTRKAMLGPEAFKASFVPVGAYVAYFSIPAEPQDGPRARWYTTVGHRAVAIRPYTKDISSVYLVTACETPELLQAYSSNDQMRQKQTVADLYKNVPFQEVPRILDSMMSTQNFYFQRVVQVKVPPSSWSGFEHGAGRISLVGDAGYCGGPFTGMGTSLAILGAYYLALEVAKEIKSQETTGKEPDMRTALSNYAEKFAPFVKEAQAIPLFGYLPKLIFPGSWLGVWLFSTMVWAFDRLKLIKLMSWLPESPVETFALPDFPV